jgi:hypothetical protein
MVPALAVSRPTARLGVALRAGHPCYFVGFTPDPMPGQTIEDIMLCRGGVPGKGHRTAPRSRRQALRHRQLPGRLGGDDAGRDPAGTVRADHHSRLAAVLLGRRRRAKPDALHRRPGRRQLGHGADQRPRQRQVRRRLPGRELREPESGQYPVDQELQPLVQGGHRRDRVSWSSRNGGAATSISTPRRFSGSSTSCSSATIWPPGKSSPAPATGSTCATSVRRSSVSVPRATTSPRRNRRWAGSSISMPRMTMSGPVARPSSTPSTTTSATSASSSSGGVARKEHQEFASNIDLIDVLPPGLYEAVMTPRTADGAPIRTGHGRLDRALRAAHAERRARHRPAQSPKTSAVSPPRGGCRRSTWALYRSPVPALCEGVRSTIRPPNGCTSSTMRNCPMRSSPSATR